MSVVFGEEAGVFWGDLMLVGKLGEDGVVGVGEGGLGGWKHLSVTLWA